MKLFKEGGMGSIRRKESTYKNNNFHQTRWKAKVQKYRYHKNRIVKRD